MKIRNKVKDTVLKRWVFRVVVKIRILAVSLIALSTIGMVFLFAAVSKTETGSLSSELRVRLERMTNNEKIHVLVTLHEQADLRGIRGNYSAVRRRLQEIADKRESQTDGNSFRMIVERLINSGDIASVQRYWLVNAYSFIATKRAIEGFVGGPWERATPPPSQRLPTCKEIERIEHFPKVELDEDDVQENADLDSAYYGPVYLKATEAWALGYQGEGVLVGIIDTGVYHNHPAIDGKMSTIQGGPDSGKLGFYTGHEISSPLEDETEPHGTHVTGIIVGGKAIGGSESIDQTKHIGVAPYANYIFGQTKNPIGSMEWMADPDKDPNTKDYPIVINNSWISSDTSINEWMDNLEALGITVVFSAGNNNNDSPKSIKGIHNYPTALLVGNIMEDYKPCPWSSSAGPAVYNMEEFIKPDVSAPGTNILSSVYPGGYKDYPPDIGVPDAIYKSITGTSMSAPMVTGVIALVQEAYFEETGEYLSPSKIKSILQLTATNLGDDNGKDTKTGSGLVDAIEAINLALNHGTVKGIVKDTLGNSIPFVTIQFTHFGLQYEMYTNIDGEFELALPGGDYSIKFNKLGHEPYVWGFHIENGETIDAGGLIIQDVPAYLVIETKEIEFYAGVGGAIQKNILLANYGSEDLIITGIDINNPHFFIKNVLLITIAPFKTEELIIQYKPEEPGEETAELLINSNAVNSDGIVKLIGYANNMLFTDVASIAKLDENPLITTTKIGISGGSQWADINNDSWPDVFIGGHFLDKLQYDTMFLSLNNKDGTFTPAQDMNGIYNWVKDANAISSIQFIDMDNDGDQDCLVSIGGKDTCQLKLLLNDGSGIFSQGIKIFEAMFRIDFCILDVDNNGLLDIIADNQTPSITIFMQNEKLVFEEKISYILSDIGIVGPFDYDNDSVMEILCLGYSKVGMIKNINLNPEIIELSSLTNISGFALADYDNDRDMDIYLQIKKNIDGSFAYDAILRNEQDGTFTQVGSPYVPTSETHFFASPPTWVDYDNDGNKDLFFPYQNKGYNRLFRDSGDHMNYEEVAKFVGIQGEASQSSTDNPNATTWVDYDRDGDMDACILNDSWYHFLYKNNYYEQGNTNHWLDIKLIGTVSNRDAIGARVVLYMKDGGIQSDQVLPSHITLGHEYRQIHFGLGDKTSSDIEKVVVYWPSGIAQEVLLDTIDNIVVIMEPINIDEDTSVDINLINYSFNIEQSTFTIVSYPNHGILDISIPNLTYIPKTNYNGSDSFSLKVNNISMDLFIFSIIINPVNDAPILNPIGNKTVDVGQKLEFVLGVNDLDGDTMKYMASALPNGAAFDTDTGTFSWTPEVNQVGTYNINFTVTDTGDPQLSDSEDITINVINLPPPAPKNLKVIKSSNGKWLLKWDKVIDSNLVGYYIYVKDSKGWKCMNSIPIKSTQVTLNFSGKGTYVFMVKAVDKYGLLSEPSNTATYYKK